MVFFMVEIESKSVGEFLVIDKILKRIDVAELHNPICIQGMPGTADIGKVALDQLIAALQPEKIMEITFDDYPAGAIINESLLYAPKAEVYLWKDPRGMQDILFVTADAQPMSPKGIYGISEYLSGLMFRFGIKLIVSLGGFPLEQCNKRAKVYISATSQAVLEPYLKYPNVEKIVKGVVLGVNGLVPTLAKMKHDIEGVVLLAETNGYEAMQNDAYDLRASVNLVEVLQNQFNLPIEAKFTEDKIQGMETKLVAEKESIKEELGLNNSKVPALNYFG
jgi:proteasome assembly chaperone (PAC2) family protein